MTDKTCEISITKSAQLGAPDVFSWSVRPLGCFPDECAGSPFGANCRDLSECLCDAVKEAKTQGFNGARLWTYMGRTIDTRLNDDGFDLERAKILLELLSTDSWPTKN